jgi:hypothetical protein
MAVRADHVALCDLVEYRLPTTHSDPRGDRELLVAEVIKLKNDRVGLAAVSARMDSEELEEERSAFCDQCVPSTLGRGEIALPVREVVPSFVRGATRAAVRVEFSQSATVPRELRRGLHLAANAAALSRGLRHEHMFALGADGLADLRRMSLLFFVFAKTWTSA